METAAPDQRLTYRVEEVAKMLGLSRNAAYASVAAGEIPSLKFGRRLVVPRKAFEQMLEMQSKEN